MIDVKLKRLALEILKPHHPDVLELAGAIAACRPDYRLLLTVLLMAGDWGQRHRCRPGGGGHGAPGRFAPSSLVLLLVAADTEKRLVRSGLIHRGGQATRP